MLSEIWNKLVNYIIKSNIVDQFKTNFSSDSLSISLSTIYPNRGYWDAFYLDIIPMLDAWIDLYPILSFWTLNNKIELNKYEINVENEKKPLKKPIKSL